MARFIEIRTKRDYYGSEMYNIFWYRDDGIPLLNESDLNHYIDQFLAGPAISLFSTAVSGVTHVEIQAQGYSDQGVRAPYLPVIRPWVGNGTYAGTGEPGVVAAILACKVEPVVAGRRMKADGSIVTTPVRRGYWAFGGIGLNAVSPEGRLVTWNEAAGVFYDATVRLTNPLTGPGTVGNAVPVVVSKPLPGETLRGHGLIKAAAWRENISTRRSRKRGVGA